MELKYYFYIDNEKINGKGQCEDDTAVEVTQEVYNDDIERYIWNGSEIVLDPDYEEKQAQKAFSVNTESRSCCPCLCAWVCCGLF